MPNDNKLVTLADLGEAYNDLDSKKKEVQTAVTDPTASGTAVAFIDSISQDAQGVITPTKKTIPTATQSADGLMSAADKAKLDSAVTGVKGSEEASYRTGNVSISAENVGALVSDFSELDPVGTFTGNERIPLYLNGENYSTDMQTLLSSAGGNSSNQGAITDHKKVCGPISSLPWTSAADSNITADMYLSYATSSKPSVLSVFDWSTSNDGTVTISAKNGGGAITLSESVTLTLYFSVGFSTAPSILTNLGSNSADNILKTAPRPGVYGTLGIANGGTNASSASAARTNLDVYSKSETDAAIAQSAADMLTTSDIVNNLITAAADKPASANTVKLLNETRPVKRKKNVTLGRNNTASVSDIISDGEVGVLFVQQNTFSLQNIGYMALVRRVGTVYYVTSPSWPTSESLRPTLGTDGVLSVTSTQYSGTYVCMFIVLS